MNKIAIICPYFGKFPSSIDLTFKSMNRNSFIDWYIFTDIKGYKDKYNNIFFIDMSFEKLKKIIKNKIGTEVYTVYKLCDYKPTYGYIFESYIEKYEFWGYCDLDVIFGDLSKFITNEKLNYYDKIYDLGHLSVLRNNREMREAFKKFKGLNYKQILNGKFIFVFDETYDTNHKGINGTIEEMGYKVYDYRKEYADISIKYSNFYPNNYKKAKKYYFLYKNGNLYLKIYNNNSFEVEVSYIHLQQKKDIPVYVKNNFKFITITPKGFFSDIECHNDMFYKINTKLFWYLKFRIKRKIKNYKERKNLDYKF